jgi:hypothetical protein
VMRGDETFQQLYRRMVRQLPRVVTGAIAGSATVQSRGWSRRMHVHHDQRGD